MAERTLGDAGAGAPLVSAWAVLTEDIVSSTMEANKLASGDIGRSMPVKLGSGSVQWNFHCYQEVVYFPLYQWKV